MLPYFLGIVGLLFLLALALGYFTEADPKKLAKMLRGAGGIILLVLAAVLVARGLFVYAVPLAWIGYSLLRGKNPFPASFPGTANKSSGQQSKVRTDFIEMRLDHDTGDMEGLVLQGKREGCFLSALSLEELLDLLAECNKRDQQAAQLLMAYLDSHHEEWRERAGAEAEENMNGSGAAKSGGPMTEEEAYEILGLEPNATDSAIRKAHRTLMKKLHPDQEGGSTYLAARVNQAKDLLLGRK